MLSMPPALAHTAKSKAIKRSSVEGMSKRSAVCTAKSGAVETCGNRSRGRGRGRNRVRSRIRDRAGSRKQEKGHEYQD